MKSAKAMDAVKSGLPSTPVTPVDIAGERNYFDVVRLANGFRNNAAGNSSRMLFLGFQVFQEAYPALCLTSRCVTLLSVRTYTRILWKAIITFFQPAYSSRYS